MRVDRDMFQVLTRTKVSSTSILEVDPNLFQRQKVGFYVNKTKQKKALEKRQGTTSKR